MNEYPNDYDLPVWEYPGDYGGFSPDGDFIIVSQNRDSGALDRSNYLRIMEDLEKLEETLPEPPTDKTRPGDDYDAPWVYDFRASHWGFGWVEYLLIRRDSPNELQRAVYEILGALSDYPIYNENHFSELECGEAEKYWENMDISERMELCEKAGISVFAARRDYIPADISGIIYEYCRGD